MALLAHSSGSIDVAITEEEEAAPSADGQHEDRELGGLAEYLDPKSIEPHVVEAGGQAGGDNGAPLIYHDVSIHFYIKTSGKVPYIERAEHIADTWGRNADQITFLFDNSNHENVEIFARERPWTAINHVEGTDRQGDYKGQGKAGEALPWVRVRAAYKAQRLKTRAVFTDFFDPALPQPNADWVCYFDDDMVVNLPNLKMDLLEKEQQCAPNCLISDRQGYGGIQYTAGGWCMQHHLAQRVNELLKYKTDEDLGWKNTDDVCFNKQVMTNSLGVVVMDSDKWYSELSWRKKSKKRLKLGSLKTHTIGTFMERMVPNLAVYHTKFEIGDPVNMALQAESGNIAGQEGNQRRRQLRGIDAYSDPKSVMDISRSLRPTVNNDVSIHFFIKSSGRQPYMERATQVADTWGKDTDGITFLFDSYRKRDNIRFGRKRRWVGVNHVEGTDHQGEYKGTEGAVRGKAYQAQRVKTRAVFSEFDVLEQKPDWVCYLDDDMMVNVPNLKADLLQKEALCSPDCLIADGQKFMMSIPYTVGGWCMERNLAQRVSDLLKDKSDQELNWTGTDDLGFNKHIMQQWLGVTVTNSEEWYSEYSRPIVMSDDATAASAGLQKFTRNEAEPKEAATWAQSQPTWEKDGAFMQEFVPSLAVYHVRYAQPA